MTGTLSERVEDFIFEIAHAMSDAELQASIARCDRLTETNCGWLEYGIGKIVRWQCGNELRSRKALARDAVEAGKARIAL